MSGAVWVLVGAAIVAGASRLRVGTLNSPGPGFLPLLTGVAIVVLAAGILVHERARRRAARGAPAARPAPGNRVAVALAVGALLAYAVLLEPLGYVVTTALFMVFALRALGRLGWRAVLTSTILTTAASWALFSVWLKVPVRTWPQVF